MFFLDGFSSHSNKRLIQYLLCRFNPLYEEDIKKKNDTSKDLTDNEDHETISTTSSGYGSNSTQKGGYILLVYYD